VSGAASTERWISQDLHVRRMSPQAHEEAIIMTWDQAALVLMRTVPIFGKG
jgi:hypothetical protein